MKADFKSVIFEADVPGAIASQGDICDLRGLLVFERINLLSYGDNVNKKITMVLLGMIGGAAMAQSNVTISGGVAVAYERSTLEGSKSRLTGYDASANNITFKGVEDLGGGLKIGFELNKRFNSVDGKEYASRSFENALVSVGGGFGLVKLGRHQAISVAAYDAFGGLGVPFDDAKGPSGDQDYAYNNRSGSRYDGAISYTSPNLGGFVATFVTTKNPTVNTDRESTAFSLAYGSGALSTMYVYELVGAKIGDVRRSDKNLGLSYNFGVAKALLLWGQEGSAQARTSVGAVVPLTSSVNLRGTYRTKGESVNAAGVKTAKKAAWALGADYSLSKRTNLFADYGDYKDSAQAAYRIGIKHTF